MNMCVVVVGSAGCSAGVATDHPPGPGAPGAVCALPHHHQYRSRDLRPSQSQPATLRTQQQIWPLCAGTPFTPLECFDFWPLAFDLTCSLSHSDHSHGGGQEVLRIPQSHVWGEMTS